MCSSVSPNIQISDYSNRFTSSTVRSAASHQRYAPQKLDSPPALDLPQQHTEGLAVSAYLAGSARNRVRGVAPRAAVADAIVADDMMLKLNHIKVAGFRSQNLNVLKMSHAPL